jgi:hypothetical protein
MTTINEKRYHIRTKYEPQLYNDWEITDISDKEEAQYIVSKLKDELLYPDKGIYVPYIDKQMIVCVAIELINDGSFTTDYIYDFICEHWSSVENGRDLGILADYLYQCCNWDPGIGCTLAERLMNQLDNEGYMTIYRGYNEYSREDGNSYTLSKDKAIWFANRFSDNGYVNKYKIHIYDVLAFITNRGEAEIIAMPNDVILLENDFWRKTS